MASNLLLQLYNNPNTVFTTKEISMLFPDLKSTALKNRLNYYVKQKQLLSPRHGIYTKPTFNTFEFANKIYSPSYISFETVLAKHGVTFQNYTSIFVASYLTRELKVADISINYIRINSQILTNPAGIENDLFSMATLERAFLDTIYYYKDYHFDNLQPINWDKIRSIQTIYPTQKFKTTVESYYKVYKDGI
ncbi:MAG: hypothetical protein O2871_00745 [bacterium]|nr:hypothetical protein [bacterium]